MDCFGTYFTHVQTCNVTRVQSATEWTNSRSAVTGKGMKKSGAWKTGGLSSHRCWPQNTVRVVNHTEKSKKTKKSMIPISGSKWWFCHSEIEDYMFSWDGKKSGGKFMQPRWSFNIEAESWANSSIWFSLSVSEKSQIAQLTSVDGWNPATLMFEPPTGLESRLAAFNSSWALNLSLFLWRQNVKQSS